MAKKKNNTILYVIAGIGAVVLFVPFYGDSAFVKLMKRLNQDPKQKIE